ncbi:MAG TPA: hypothetical protein VFB82_13840 [Blastocatellia bacterium]|nr:hypothetical protein [Blastocatellia bacterium]
MSNQESNNHVVLGQKYAYATVSLVLAVMCFVSLVGLEKAILAIIFGWLALKDTPGPRLTERRLWAKIAIALAAFVLVVVPTVILLNLDRLRGFIDVFAKLTEGK